jgi:hypothetical protein
MDANGLLVREDKGTTSWVFLSPSKPGSRPDGELCRPTRGWRSLRVGGRYMAIDPRRRAGGSFREYKLSPSVAIASFAGSTSVLALPDMVSAEECAHLAAAADKWCAACAGADLPASARGLGPAAASLTRVECHVDGRNLDGRAHALAMVILSRALWNLETLRPDDALRIFGQRASLGDMTFAFSGHEPAINVYTRGGQFEPHEDKYMCTVLVPLSPLDGFEGGGTGFWSDDAPRVGGPGGEPTLVLRPPPGTALMWRGDVTHAGLPVSAGTRHVFVCSFDLHVCNG